MFTQKFLLTILVFTCLLGIGAAQIHGNGIMLLEHLPPDEAGPPALVTTVHPGCTYSISVGPTLLPVCETPTVAMFIMVGGVSLTMANHLTSVNHSTGTAATGANFMLPWSAQPGDIVIVAVYYFCPDGSFTSSTGTIRVT